MSGNFEKGNTCFLFLEFEEKNISKTLALVNLRSTRGSIF